MIKELMIGNTVNYQYEAYEIWSIANNSTATSEHYYVDLDSKSADKHLKGIDVNLISPIPLTEDILIRCGFMRHKVTMSAADMWQGMDGWSLGDSGWLFRGNLKSGGLRLVEYFNTKIFYLHQLQNLLKLLCNQTIELK